MLIYHVPEHNPVSNEPVWVLRVTQLGLWSLQVWDGPDQE